MDHSLKKVEPKSWKEDWLSRSDDWYAYFVHVNLYAQGDMVSQPSHEVGW